MSVLVCGVFDWPTVAVGKRKGGPKSAAPPLDGNLSEISLGKLVQFLGIGVGFDSTGGAVSDRIVMIAALAASGGLCGVTFGYAVRMLLNIPPWAAAGASGVAGVVCALLALAFAGDSKGGTRNDE